MKDFVGIGWRSELAAGIFSNLSEIDVVEVIADDLFDAPSRELRAMQTLAAQVPIVLHGVSLGLASASAVSRRRLDRMARVVNAIEPSFWSEHLAFVRADGVEVGHLAAPPRTNETVDGGASNVEHAARIVGKLPLLENVATLIEPPGSVLDEPTWISSFVHTSGVALLLDLNNLYANAVNFGHDPFDFMEQMPLDHVSAVHLAGGRWIQSSMGEERLLDDHLHDVPEVVYTLLTEVAARAPRPLTVVLERDGAYPPFGQLLAQLRRAREALEMGRLRAIERAFVCDLPAAIRRGAPYRAQPFEAYLARLYVDADARRRFLADPRGEAQAAGLDVGACEALERIDRVGLELAAHSFAHKRRRATG